MITKVRRNGRGRVIRRSGGSGKIKTSSARKKETEEDNNISSKQDSKMVHVKIKACHPHRFLGFTHQRHGGT